MNLNSLKNLDKENKTYIKVSLIEHPEILKGYLNLSEDDSQYKISESAIESICKHVGVSTTLNNILRSKDTNVWGDTVLSMYKHYYPDGLISLLVDDGVVEYVSFKEYQPMLNIDFLGETSKTLSDYQDIIDLESFNYDIHNINSNVLIFNRNSFNYQGEDYRFGVLITNDELSSVSCIYAVQYEDIIFYLPSKYCGLSSARYMRSSQDSKEAYKLLLLRIISEMSTENWFNLVPEISMNIRNCKKIPVTYEEYRKAFRMLNRTALFSDIDELEIKDILEDIEDKYRDFQDNYPSLEDKKGSYIWRCSAVSDSSVYSLISSVHEIVKSHHYYPEALLDVRQTLGDFLMLNKISTELAKKKSRGEPYGV